MKNGTIKKACVVYTCRLLILATLLHISYSLDDWMKDSKICFICQEYIEEKEDDDYYHHSREATKTVILSKHEDMELPPTHRNYFASPEMKMKKILEKIQSDNAATKSNRGTLLYIYEELKNYFGR